MSRVSFFSDRFLPRLLKNQKNFEKEKQNSTNYVGPRGSHRAIVSRYFVCFFKVFAIFGEKPIRSRESKKTHRFLVKG